jgi:hypothetical protein
MRFKVSSDHQSNQSKLGWWRLTYDVHCCAQQEGGKYQAEERAAVGRLRLFVSVASKQLEKLQEQVDDLVAQQVGAPRWSCHVRCYLLLLCSVFVSVCFSPSVLFFFPSFFEGVIIGWGW